MRCKIALGCALTALALATPALGAPEYMGTNTHSLRSSVSAEDMVRELTELQSLDANAVRVDLDWRTLEYKGRGEYEASYLARIDSMLAEAATRGIKVIAILATTPPWASEGKAWNDAPTNASDYGAACKFLAARYGVELAAIEVWNEPEIKEDLIGTSDLPLTYTHMTQACFSGAREGNAEVPVITGSLSYADTTFLNQLYADGIAGSYDGISIHPYADQAAPENTSVTHSFKRGIETLHEDQLAHNDSTPEWVTEYGWYTGTASGAVSEQTQAEYIQRSWKVLGGLSYVKAATLYQLRDLGTEASNPEDNFGLLRADFSARLADAPFRDGIEELVGTTSSTTTTTTSSQTSTSTTSTATQPVTTTTTTTSSAPPPVTTTTTTTTATSTAKPTSTTTSTTSTLTSTASYSTTTTTATTTTSSAAWRCKGNGRHRCAVVAAARARRPAGRHHPRRGAHRRRSGHRHHSAARPRRRSRQHRAGLRRRLRRGYTARSWPLWLRGLVHLLARMRHP